MMERILKRSIILAACVTALAGCASMKSATINEDGSSHEHSVSVPPFSKQAIADFAYFQEVDKDGNYTQRIGTRGEGMDTTGQLEAFKGLMALGQILAPMLQRPASEIQTPDGQRVDLLGKLQEIIASINDIAGRVNRIEGNAPPP